MLAVKIVFWASLGLLVWTHLGYPLAAALAARIRRRRVASSAIEPSVSVIVAAHNEADVIERRVRNLLELDYPADRIEVLVASDASTDGMDELVSAAAEKEPRIRLLACPRGGKLAAMNRAVPETDTEIVAFTDANATWEPDALRKLVRNFADPDVAYVCGQVRFQREDGTNKEGLYWRYELWLRESESALGSITGGNGAIYAVRPKAYVRVDPVMGHDLKLPFTLVKRGWRAVYEPGARASEKMVPTIEGEFARKRRMMSHMWPIVLRGGLLSPRGYPPLYALMIASHRVLRYVGPFLHLITLAASVVLALSRDGRRIERAALAAQVALVGAAVAGGRVRSRPLLVARYYVLTTASIAAGLVDHLRHGTAAGWTPPEGTR